MRGGWQASGWVASQPASSHVPSLPCPCRPCCQGLTYSTVGLACTGGYTAPGEDSLSVNCTITAAAGSPAGDQVLQVRPLPPPPPSCIKPPPPPSRPFPSRCTTAPPLTSSAASVPRTPSPSPPSLPSHARPSARVSAVQCSGVASRVAPCTCPPCPRLFRRRGCGRLHLAHCIGRAVARRSVGSARAIPRPPLPRRVGRRRKQRHACRRGAGGRRRGATCRAPAATAAAPVTRRGKELELQLEGSCRPEPGG